MKPPVLFFNMHQPYNRHENSFGAGKDNRADQQDDGNGQPDFYGGVVQALFQYPKDKRHCKVSGDKDGCPCRAVISAQICKVQIAFAAFFVRGGVAAQEFSLPA